MPMLILIILGLPSIKVLYAREKFNFLRALTLKVTGQQWL